MNDFEFYYGMYIKNLHISKYKCFLLELDSNHNIPFVIYKTVEVEVGRVAQLVERLSTGWTVQGSNPGLGRDFPPVQTDPRAHPASCTMGTVSIPEVKHGRGVLLTTHPPSSAVDMEDGRVELYLYPPSGPQPGQ